MKPRRQFAHPVLSALLALVWLALQQSLALPQLLTAALLGWGLPRLLHGFLPAASRVRRWRPLPRLVALVLWDILVSSITVARLVLSPTARPQPLWVPVPLALHDPLAISLFALIITTTPGTVSCIIDERGRQILVHALDGSDAEAIAAQMKQRYEQPLLEMFPP